MVHYMFDFTFELYIIITSYPIFLTKTSNPCCHSKSLLEGSDLVLQKL